MSPWLVLLFWFAVIGLSVPVLYALASVRPGLMVALFVAFAVAAAVSRAFGK